MLDSFWKASSEAYWQANGRLSVRKAIESERENVAGAFCKSALRRSWTLREVVVLPYFKEYRRFRKKIEESCGF